MKPDIHPKYGPSAVTCSCGHHFEIKSTRQGPLQIEVCFKCHPFMTGKQKIVDTSGRVERFEKKYRRQQGNDQASQ